MSQVQARGKVYNYSPYTQAFCFSLTKRANSEIQSDEVGNYTFKVPAHKWSENLPKSTRKGLIWTFVSTANDHNQNLFSRSEIDVDLTTHGLTVDRQGNLKLIPADEKFAEDTWEAEDQADAASRAQNAKQREAAKDSLPQEWFDCNKWLAYGLPTKGDKTVPTLSGPYRYVLTVERIGLERWANLTKSIVEGEVTQAEALLDEILQDTTIPLVDRIFALPGPTSPGYRAALVLIEYGVLARKNAPEMTRMLLKKMHVLWKAKELHGSTNNDAKATASAAVLKRILELSTYQAYRLVGRQAATHVYGLSDFDPCKVLGPDNGWAFSNQMGGVSDQGDLLSQANNWWDNEFINEISWLFADSLIGREATLLMCDKYGPANWNILFSRAVSRIPYSDPFWKQLLMRTSVWQRPCIWAGVYNAFFRMQNDKFAAVAAIGLDKEKVMENLIGCNNTVCLKKIGESMIGAGFITSEEYFKARDARTDRAKCDWMYSFESTFQRPEKNPFAGCWPEEFENWIAEHKAHAETLAAAVATENESLQDKIQMRAKWLIENPEPEPKAPAPAPAPKPEPAPAAPASAPVAAPVQQAVPVPQQAQQPVNVVPPANQDFTGRMQQFKLTLHSARLDTAADSNGLADPYVKLKSFNQKLFKSSVKKKTLQPNWNESVVLQGVDARDGFANIHVEIWDQDLFTNDYMNGGVIVIPVDPSGQAKKGQNVQIGLKTKSGRDDGVLIFSVE